MRSTKARLPFPHCFSLSAFLFSLFFSFMTLLGRSFEENGSWHFSSILATPAYLAFTIVELILWFLLAFVIVNLLYRALDMNKLSPPRVSHGHSAVFTQYLARVSQRPVSTIFLTLFLIRLPRILLDYPVRFMGDTPYQLRQLLTDVGLDAMHPPVHTLTLGLFVRIGQALGNINVGLLLYSLFQSAFLLLIISFVLAVLLRMGVHQHVIAFLTLYFAFHRVLIMFLSLATKDIIYTGFFLLFYVYWYKCFFSEKPVEKKQLFLLAASTVGMALFRNESRVIIILSMAGCLLFRHARKHAAMLLSLVLTITLLAENVVYPLCHVAIPARRLGEILSIPFMQTARYVCEAEEDITPEQREAIDAVLDYDKLAESYDPFISDDVKATYRDDASALPAYFKAWFQMLLTHPGIYFDAAFHNNYQFFYLNSTVIAGYTCGWSNFNYSLSQRYTDEPLFSSDFLFSFRECLDQFYDALYSLPVLRLYMLPALYIWIAIFLLSYALHRRSGRAVLFLLPLFSHMLILLLSPTNGNYSRYQFPMMMYLPFVICAILSILKQPKDGAQ